MPSADLHAQYGVWCVMPKGFRMCMYYQWFVSQISVLMIMISSLFLFLSLFSPAPDYRRWLHHRALTRLIAKSNAAPQRFLADIFFTYVIEDTSCGIQSTGSFYYHPPQETLSLHRPGLPRVELIAYLRK